MKRSSRSYAWLLIAVTPTLVQAGDENGKVNEALKPARNWPGVLRSGLGVTRLGTRIPCLITAADLDYSTEKTRILIVGYGTKVRPEESTLPWLEWFYSAADAQPYRKRFALSAVPIANPDGWAAGRTDGNLSGGNPENGYPPKGTAYNSPTDPEAAYLWRWIGMHAPDLVVVLGPGSDGSIFIPDADVAELKPLKPLGPELAPGRDLASQLVRHAPCETGTIPAVRIDGKGPESIDALRRVMDSGFRGPSPARRELQKRLARTPIEVARQLSRRYGQDLKSVAYIPALALIGRMRLGELTGDASHLADVERIVAPYVSGKKPSLPPRPSGSNLSGHLVFSELARTTGNARYLQLAKAASDLGFDKNGEPKPSMPFHNEMSDAVFMGCPILVQVGRLTGQSKYDDMALRHLRFVLKRTLRDDGLHRHSPLDEAAWGRGNGFPALGLALCLSDLPADSPVRAAMLTEFQSHMTALAKHQDPTGLWHQVIDHPGSYRELSCTCMITFSTIRGVRRGWLDEATFEPIIQKAWNGIRTRIAPNGRLVDVCTGTGKQQNLRAYLDRTAILGSDARGGAMALLVSTEMAAWKDEK